MNCTKTSYLHWSAYSLCLMMSIGCTSQERQQGVEMTTVDGVRVVRNYTPQWAPDEAWTVSEESATVIGAQEGEAPYLLHRVYDATRLDNGNIVVSNGGTGELRYFDGEGNYLFSFGRRGRGPGEFSEMSTMRMWQLSSGEILAVDTAQRRVHIVTSGGELVRTSFLRVPFEYMSAWIVDVFGDDSILVVSPEGYLTGPPNQPLETVFRYAHLASDGAFSDSLFRLPAPLRFVNQVAGVTHYPYVPFAPESYLAASGQQLFITNSAEAVIEREAIDGTLIERFEWNAVRIETQSIYSRYVREELDSITRESQRRQYEAFFGKDLPIPDHLPVSRSLHADAEGNLWVERFLLPWETEPSCEIFDADGRWLGTVHLPESIEIYEIGSDYILGRHRDKEGVETIHVYTLSKG